MSVEIEQEPYTVPTLDELRSGGKEAVEGLYRALSPELTRYGQLFVYDEGGDFVNDVFVKLLYKLPEFELEKENSLRAYLYAAVKNTALSHLRRKRNTEVELDLLRGTAHDDDVAETAVQTVFISGVLSEVKKLPPRQREVVLLTASGYNEPETADIMGTARGTVKSHLSKARKKLNEEPKFFY